jgi:hypothetical protein
LLSLIRRRASAGRDRHSRFVCVNECRLGRRPFFATFTLPWEGDEALEHADAAKVAAIKAELAAGKGTRRIGRELEAGVGAVMRIKAEIAA